MAITSGPQIAISQIHAEVGGTGQASLNDADLLGMIPKSAGVQVAMSEWYGKKAPAQYLGSVSAVQGSSNNTGVFSLSLASLNLQAGDLVIAFAAQEGPGEYYTDLYSSGWASMAPDTPNTQPGHACGYKIMGSTPDSSVGWTLGPYYFSVPFAAIAFRNVSTRTAHNWNGVNYGQSVSIPSRTVSNAGSVSVICTSRGGNNAEDTGTSTLNTPSGWTKAVHRWTSNAGIGYNHEQSVTMFYRMNPPTGTLSPGNHTWYFLGDTKTSHSIFY
jgi:hypothetical protein